MGDWIISLENRTIILQDDNGFTRMTPEQASVLIEGLQEAIKQAQANSRFPLMVTDQGLQAGRRQ